MLFVCLLQCIYVFINFANLENNYTIKKNLINLSEITIIHIITYYLLITLIIIAEIHNTH